MSDRQTILAAFPRERNWLLPALQAVQHHERWLSPDALVAVAGHLRVPRSEVYGVATHYPELRMTEPGRRIVRVCVGVSCRALGSLDVLAALERRLAVAADGTTADGEFTLERLDCGFCCAMAPVVEVDGRNRQVDIYRWHLANPDKQWPGLAYWGHYVAHDNNRDAMG
ncbi:MAG TPA: hypothetical protein DCQ64_03405, partial [Candidatus Rokubacteria bacterium]|nr:hypothetical protein [Candidatus Rokubacteria bacterium]